MCIFLPMRGSTQVHSSADRRVAHGPGLDPTPAAPPVARSELQWIERHHCEALRLANHLTAADRSWLDPHDVVVHAYEALQRRSTPWRKEDPAGHARAQIRWSFRTLVEQRRRDQRRTVRLDDAFEVILSDQSADEGSGGGPADDCGPSAAADPLRSATPQQQEAVAGPDWGVRPMRTPARPLPAQPSPESGAAADWQGLRPYYEHLNASLADAVTRNEVDAVGAALALVSLAAEPVEGEHRGAGTADLHMATAIAAVRPHLARDRYTNAAERQERCRLARRTRELLAPVVTHHTTEVAA